MVARDDGENIWAEAEELKAELERARKRGLLRPTGKEFLERFLNWLKRTGRLEWIHEATAEAKKLRPDINEDVLVWKELVPLALNKEATKEELIKRAQDWVEGLKVPVEVHGEKTEMPLEEVAEMEVPPEEEGLHFIRQKLRDAYVGKFLLHGFKEDEIKPPMELIDRLAREVYEGRLKQVKAMAEILRVAERDLAEAKKERALRKLGVKTKGKCRPITSPGGTFYHITLADKLDEILERGILPISARWEEFKRDVLAGEVIFRDIKYLPGMAVLDALRPNGYPPLYDVVYLAKSRAVGEANKEGRVIVEVRIPERVFGPLSYLYSGKAQKYVFAELRDKLGEEEAVRMIERLLEEAATPEEFEEKVLGLLAELVGDVREWAERTEVGIYARDYWCRKCRAGEKWCEYLFAGKIPPEWIVAVYDHNGNVIWERKEKAGKATLEDETYLRLLRSLERRLEAKGITIDYVLPEIEPELRELARAVEEGEVSFQDAVIKASRLAQAVYRPPEEAPPVQIEIEKQAPKVKTASEIVERKETFPEYVWEYTGKIPEWLKDALSNPKEVSEMLFYGVERYLKEKAEQFPGAEAYADFLAKWLAENVIYKTIKRLEAKRRNLREGLALYLLENYGGVLVEGGMDALYKRAAGWVKYLLKTCSARECGFALKFATDYKVCYSAEDYHKVKVVRKKESGYTCEPGLYYLMMSTIAEALKTVGGSEADLPEPYRLGYEKFISKMVEEFSRR